MNKKSVGLKLLIVGDSGVGKTSLLMRYTEDKFHTDFLSTIGVDYKVKKIQTDSHEITLNIWDTAGQERFRNITKTFFKGANGVILVYSVTDMRSFQQLTSWIHQVKENGSETANMILVGSKSDLVKERQVSEKMGRQMSEKFNLPWVQTSAKDNQNIEKVFDELIKSIMKNMKEETVEKPRSGSISGKKLKKQEQKKKKKCC